MRDVYIQNFSKIFSFCGSYTLNPPPFWVKFGLEEWTFADILGALCALLHAHFHPHRCNVLPLWGKNLKVAL